MTDRAGGDPSTLSPATLREISLAFQRSRVLLTAMELRVFTELADGEMPATELAAMIGADARATDRLMNALCTLGVLAKAGGRFRNTAEGRRYLVEGQPDFSGGLAHTASMWHAWSHLTESVRQGRPAIRDAINDRGDAWLGPFIAAMHYRAAQQAPVTARLLALSGVRRLLDVGGGSGAFAMACAAQEPDLRAVIYDLPNVVPLTQRYIEEAGLADRVTTAVGNYLVDPLPGGFDVIFLSAVVHSNAADENAALIRTCAGALARGGRVVISDWVMDDTRTAPVAGAFFALNMLVATEHGDTFTEREMGAWLSDAGLSVEPRIDTPFGTSLMTGRK